MEKLTTAQVETAAKALAEHKGLRWMLMPDSWREEQRKQVRLTFEAAGRVIDDDEGEDEDLPF